jgi:hypothetical protein
MKIESELRKLYPSRLSQKRIKFLKTNVNLPASNPVAPTTFIFWPGEDQMLLG